MSTPSAVGLFVDFDGVRYSTLRLLEREPDCRHLMDRARAYGPVAVAVAYADFSLHPPYFERRLEVAGITPRNIGRPSADASPGSGADMAMLMDIVDCLLDRPNVGTLMLVTGSAHFVRVCTRARHRFGRRVVVGGVAGSMPRDLIDCADVFDPLYGEGDRPPVGAVAEAAQLDSELDDDAEVKLLQLIDWLASHRPYLTFSFIRSHALSPHHALDLTDTRATEILSRFKERGILTEGTRHATDGRALRTVSLNHHHPALAAARRRSAPTFEAQNSAARHAGAPLSSPGTPDPAAPDVSGGVPAEEPGDDSAATRLRPTPAT